MIEPRFLTNLLVVVALSAAYFVAGKLGLLLAFVHHSATAVWPPTGITLAALLALGYHVWPGIFLGAFLVNITTAGSVATSLGIAVGNTLEGLVGAFLVKRFANWPLVFDQPKDVLRFAVLAGLLSTTVASTFGVTSLVWGGVARWADYGSIWLTWWLGDAVGDFVVAPAILLWSAQPRVCVNRREALEITMLVLMVVLVGQMVFGEMLPTGMKNYPLDYLCLPLLVWVAFRFGQREAATTTLLLSSIALWGTLHGFGPFVRDTPHESLLLLQGFMGGTAIMALAFAAVVSERKQAEEVRARLAAIVESADVAIIGKNLAGIVTSWNKGAECIFGYTAEEMIGKPISVLIPADCPDGEQETTQRVQQGEHTGQYETVHRKKDGTDIPVSLTISAIRDRDGHIIGTSKIVRDLTERKQGEEQFRLMVESAPSGILMIDQTGSIRLINMQLEKMFGYSREELLEHSVELLVPERFRAQHSTDRASFLAAPSARAMGVGRDLFGVRKDGTEFPIEIGLTPLRTINGPRVLASIVDITERKRAEGQIQASLREKEVLLREIHHRVKNNLQVIHSLLRLQSQAVTDEKVLQLFRDSQARVRAIALLHETLYQSHEFSRINMREYISTLIGQLFQSYGASPDAIRPTLKIAPVSLSIETAITCGLLISELVSNSLKHAFPEGRTGDVLIDFLSDHSEKYTVVVGDNGVGLPANFDVGAVQSLGWQLIPMLVEQLNGTYEVQRSEGTAVKITLSEIHYNGRI